MEFHEVVRKRRTVREFADRPVYEEPGENEAEDLDARLHVDGWESREAGVTGR